MCYQIMLPKRKREILKVLSQQNCTNSELCRFIGINPASTSAHLRSMFEEGFVERRDGKYGITWKGRILFKAVETIENTLSVIDRNREFWNSHDLSCIPEELLLKLGDIGNYTILKSHSKDVLGYMENFSEIIRDAKWIKVILGYYLPYLVDELIKVSKTIPVSVIVSKKIVSKLSEKRFWVELTFHEKVDLVCIITDKFMCLGLPDGRGVYDVSCGLISDSNGAIRWGLELFNYFADSNRCIHINLSLIHI